MIKVTQQLNKKTFRSFLVSNPSKIKKWKSLATHNRNNKLRYEKIDTYVKEVSK